jgi:hypothetical protein
VDPLEVSGESHKGACREGTAANMTTELVFNIVTVQMLAKVHRRFGAATTK